MKLLNLIFIFIFLSRHVFCSSQYNFIVEGFRYNQPDDRQINSILNSISSLNVIKNEDKFVINKPLFTSYELSNSLSIWKTRMEYLGWIIKVDIIDIINTITGVGSQSLDSSTMKSSSEYSSSSSSEYSTSSSSSSSSSEYSDSSPTSSSSLDSSVSSSISSDSSIDSSISYSSSYLSPESSTESSSSSDSYYNPNNPNNSDSNSSSSSTSSSEYSSSLPSSDESSSSSSGGSDIEIRDYDVSIGLFFPYENLEDKELNRSKTNLRLSVISIFITLLFYFGLFEAHRRFYVRNYNGEHFTQWIIGEMEVNPVKNQDSDPEINTVQLPKRKSVSFSKTKQVRKKDIYVTDNDLYNDSVEEL
jgi:hypothetical protein